MSTHWVRRLDPLGALLAVVWFGAWVGTIATRDGWDRSFAQSAEAVNSCSIIVWPLAGACGCAFIVSLKRRGVMEFARGLPGDAAWRLLARTCVVTTAWAAASGLTAMAAAAVVAGIHGSPPSAAPLRGWLIACLGVCALWWIGALAGWLVPSYATAVAVMAAQYLLPWRVAAAGIVDIMGFTGVTAGIGDAVQLSPRAISAWSAALLLSAAACAAWLRSAITWHSDGSSRHRSGVALAALLTAGVIGGGAAVVTVARGEGWSVWERQGPDAWVCQPVGRATSVTCATRDIAAEVPQQAASLGRVDDLLRVAWPQRKVSYVYALDLAAMPSLPPNAVHVPLETDLAQPQHWWAQSVVSYLLLTDASLPRTSGAAPEVCAALPEALSDQLEGVMRGEPVRVDGFRHDVEQARGCNG